MPVISEVSYKYQVMTIRRCDYELERLLSIKNCHG